MCRPKITCVVGPTASGKTAFAVEFAKAHNGEVVSCDSMQIYRHMDIGTAKPTQQEMQGVPHHMLDFVEPTQLYSVADFVRDARICIENILSRDKLPVLCGGTGLYVDSIIYQIEFPPGGRDDAYRRQLQELAEQEGCLAVHALLRKVDPQAAEAIHPNNVKRVIRALEICKTTGMTKTQADVQAQKTPLYDAALLGLTMERKALYQRIDHRVDKMMEQGLLQEVKHLIAIGVGRDTTAMQAIGYKELLNYLEGQWTLEEAVDTIKRESRRYAKRQLTWFRRNPAIQWIDIDKGTGAV